MSKYVEFGPSRFKCTLEPTCCELCRADIEENRKLAEERKAIAAELKQKVMAVKQ